MATKLADRVARWLFLLRLRITMEPAAQPRRALHPAASGGHFAPKAAIVPESGPVQKHSCTETRRDSPKAGRYGESAAEFLS